MKFLIFFFFVEILYSSSIENPFSTNNVVNQPPKPKKEVVIEGKEELSHQFSSEEMKKLGKNTENFPFQADVNRVMRLITHSMYSNKEIFIREVISNAVDALDKQRFLNFSSESEEDKFEIKVRGDSESKTLTITDTGIGMSKQDLIENLGTIARSGTTRFLEKIEESNSNLQLIGQFGVGFYSCFLVADEVTVITKKQDDDQYIWKSRADGSFTIAKDPRGNTLTRGTSIVLHIQDESKEYLEEKVLGDTIKRYSEFMTYPIYLYTRKVKEEKVVLEDDVDDKNEEDNDVDDEKKETKNEEDDDIRVEDENTQKSKTIEKVTFQWEHINVQPPIWTRSKEDVTDKEYNAFYRALSKDQNDPLKYVHFSAEGEIEFKSILYVPSVVPMNMYEEYYSQKSTIRLYVRRVLINDQFDKIMPRYLNFIKGLVDSNDLPLNVNREQIQKNKIMKTISKRLTKKALSMLKKMAEEKDENGAKNNETSNYIKFWNNFGKSIKLGVFEDYKNSDLLKKLLRFHSSMEEKNFVSLEDYVSRMKKNQKGIFYIAGENIETIKKSPNLERVIKAGYEVLYFNEPVDEYLIPHMRDFDGHNLISVAAEGFELYKTSKSEKKHWENVQNDFKPLTNWLKDRFKKYISKVEISKRLEDSPCILVHAQYGVSANMERIQKYQPLSSRNSQSSKKVLEINYRHPIIRQMKERIDLLDEDKTLDKTLNTHADLLFDSALLSGGFLHDEPVLFASRINSIIKSGLGISENATVEPLEEFKDDTEEEDDVDEDDDEETSDNEDDSDQQEQEQHAEL